MFLVNVKTSDAVLDFLAILTFVGIFLENSFDNFSRAISSLSKRKKLVNSIGEDISILIKLRIGLFFCNSFIGSVFVIVLLVSLFELEWAFPVLFLQFLLKRVKIGIRGPQYVDNQRNFGWELEFLRNSRCLGRELTIPWIFRFF